ncbi:MAG: tetratricopeptide repeat protein, partial [Dehalococcoidia bacterium]
AARKELGITYGMCGEFDKALSELTGALEVYEAQGDAYHIAHVNDQIGNALMALGRLSEAAGHLERARQRWSKLNNDERLVNTLNNLGMLHYLLGDYGQAEGLFREALDKARLEPTPAGEVYLLTCLGDIRRDKGELQAALDLYDSALSRGSALDEAYIRIYIMDAIAGACRLKGDIGDGESWAKRATAEAEARGGVFELGLCMLTRGLIQRDRGQLKEATSSLEESVRLLQQADARRELATARFHLAGVLFSLKRKRLALEGLEVVARLVQDMGYDHFLTVEAARNPLLVQYAAANKIADGYFGQLLKMTKAAPGARAEDSEAESQPESAGTTVQAYGFGNLRVELAGREITDLEWRSEKSKEMFFFFLCNRRPLRREEIVAALWPDLPDEKTGSAFHSNLYRLRQALYPDCIAKDSGRYILDPRGRFSFDVADFQQALQEADSLPKGGPEALALQEKALRSYKGAFAADFYSE